MSSFHAGAEYSWSWFMFFLGTFFGSKHPGQGHSQSPNIAQVSLNPFLVYDKSRTLAHLPHLSNWCLGHERRRESGKIPMRASSFGSGTGRKQPMAKPFACSPDSSMIPSASFHVTIPLPRSTGYPAGSSQSHSAEPKCCHQQLQADPVHCAQSVESKTWEHVWVSDTWDNPKSNRHLSLKVTLGYNILGVYGEITFTPFP